MWPKLSLFHLILPGACHQMLKNTAFPPWDAKIPFILVSNPKLTSYQYQPYFQEGELKVIHVKITIPSELHFPLMPPIFQIGVEGVEQQKATHHPHTRPAGLDIPHSPQQGNQQSAAEPPVPHGLYSPCPTTMGTPEGNGTPVNPVMSCQSAQ